MELLKQKVEMGILEPSSAPYLNRWFTVPKKNETLRFLQDLQPVNKVTIRNGGVGPTIDEFAEAFARR
jgi:molybdopterin-biosynthesis enzyme MoeA-like protein